MATMGTYRAETFVSGEAITQFHFVTLESDGQIDMGDPAGTQCIGVALTDATEAGRPVTVAVAGRVKVSAAGNIAAGAAVATNVAGKAVTAASTNIVMGYAVEGAASGDFVTIELIQGGNAVA